MEKFSLYFILFIIYSIIGWIMEIIVVGYEEKKFINRGFLIGPYCPIYGYGAILMIFYLERYKDNFFTVFLLAVIVCSFIEYLVSYIMEKMFNARWWDYSNRKFNINGRICLLNAFLFGVLGVLLVYFVNPFLSNLLLKLNISTLNIISIILFVVFSTDFVISMFISYKLKNNIKKMKKDSTEEINKKVKEILESKILNRRIFKAFPRFKINIISIKEIKNKIENKLDEIEEKINKKN
ncbi:MAG: putative ABC transporter permease [Bacilli bacterium]|nr:putative ABC transporter permease [Bacilli bacterium]